MRASHRLLIVAAAIGAAVWAFIGFAARREEAWDSDLYWSLGMPILLVCAALFGLLAPERPWRWGMALSGGQAAAALMHNPTGNLLPLGLIMFGVLGGVCAIPAYMSAAVRRYFGNRTAR